MREIWKGSISFGLVNIPVKAYTASKEKEISFTLLHKKDLSEIRYARICKTEDKEVPWKEIVKGYEYEKGNFVVLEDEDFEKALTKKTKAIEILSFIEQDEVDPSYYVKPYFLEPDKSAENAYSLLREALKKSNKVGLAKYVIRNREHLAVVRIHENVLILNEIRYQNELVSSKELKIPPVAKTSGKEVEMAVQLIEQLTAPFKPQKYKDTFTEEVKQIIDKKSKGRPVHPKKEAPQSGKIHDIMTLLRTSLEKNKKLRKNSRKTA